MKQNGQSIGIIGTGMAVPKLKFKNNDFVKLGLETSDEWIASRTGINQRFIAKEEATSDLAYQAAENAIIDAGIEKSDIDCIIVATTTPDYPLFPSVACLVQNGLGLDNIPAFDISAACTGFIYAMEVAEKMMSSGQYKNILVIGADTLSKSCNWKDRSTVVLFGDGAGAVVLGEVKSGYGILSSKLGARGSGFDKLIIPKGGSRTPLTKDNVEDDDRYIQMDGKAVYRFAVNTIVRVVEEALAKIGMKKEDISFLIPHQANIRIIDYAREKLGLSREQVYVNIDTYGNTSAATIPIALNEVCSKKLIRNGDILVTVGFGAGLTYGTNVIKWFSK
ncbi:MAG: 3-oxoacyl-ACP synthase [Candidatus Margulisbacteria bacterium GWF2_35_9]|nr:MAG: 3-oxoacyl-ACP synthase [Candidatus Margulisbacteria bacterium GWF2_35_9]